MELHPRTKAAIEASFIGAKILMKGFGTSFTINSKEGRHNLVTEYDHLSEKAIISFLQEKFPNDSFLSEECGEIKGGKVQWVIDPLDGTVNFAHGIPMFAISIGIKEGDEIIAGVIYQPITKELFVAEKDNGATLNGQKITVSDLEIFDDSFLSTGFPYHLIENPHQCIERFMEVLRKGIPIRRIGVAALDLAYVACGRFDGFFEVSLAPWDCAAGVLIIEEAKGKTTTWNNKSFAIDSYEPIMSTNGKIHEELATLLSKKIQ